MASFFFFPGNNHCREGTVGKAVGVEANRGKGKKNGPPPVETLEISVWGKNSQHKLGSGGVRL